MGKSLTFARNILHDSAGKSKGIQYDNIPGINTGPVSIAIWVKPLAAFSAAQHLIWVDQIASDTDDGGVRLFVGSSQVVFSIKHSSTDPNINANDDNVPLNTWTHLVGTWDGLVTSGPAMYINGLPRANPTAGSGTRNAAPGSHSIGGREATQARGWGGLLAGAGRWQRVLTAVEAKMLAEGLHPMYMHPEDLVICPDFQTLENLAPSRTSPRPNLIEHDGGIYEGPPKLSYERPKFAHTDVPKNINIVPTGSKPNPLATSLLRAFFFDSRNGTYRDAVQTGQTVDIEAGITILRPYGIDHPRTSGIDAVVINDRGMPFDFQPDGKDMPMATFFDFQWEGTVSDSEEYTLSINANGSGAAVFNLLTPGGSVIEDKLRHTLLVTASRGGGMQVYLDGEFLAEDLVAGTSASMDMHRIRYDAAQNTFEIVVDSVALASQRNIMIGGTYQSADDRWHGPVYAALYWHRKLDAADAKWMHHNYRTMLEDLQVRHFDAPMPEALPELVVVEHGVRDMPR